MTNDDDAGDDDDNNDGDGTKTNMNANNIMHIVTNHQIATNKTHQQQHLKHRADPGPGSPKL